VPLATSYNEAQLATYMLDELGPMAAELNWTGAEHVQAAVNAAIREMGVAAIGEVAGVADCGKLEAFARRAVWRRAVAHLAVEHDFDSDGQSFKRSQLQKQARTSLTLAEADAGVYASDELVVGMQTVVHHQDPYTYHPGDEWSP